MKKLLLSLLVSLLILTHGVAAAAEVQLITVALVSTSSNTALPTAVARGAGFFKEEGLEVRAVTLSSGRPIMMALLMSGHAELVVAGAVAILRGISHNASASVEI